MAERRQTRSMADGPAHERTLAIAELLENIIVHVSARTILARMLGVSRFWNNVINASPAIQTKLWRRPLSKRVSSPVGLLNSRDANKHIHPDAEAFKSSVPIYSGSYQINAVFPGSPTQQYLYYIHSHRQYPVQAVYVGTGPQNQSLAHIVIVRSYPSEANSETPSWLGMQLSEPPINTAWIEVFAEMESANSGFYEPALISVQATLRDNGGVTFGMVRDVVHKIVAHPYRPRSFRGKRVVTTRICFVADRVEISLPGVSGRTKRTVGISTGSKASKWK